MALRRLCKADDSDGKEECPAMYVTDDPTSMVAQGRVLDAATEADLQQRAADEAGVVLPTETVLRAAALFLSERGRPAVMAEVSDFLTTWDGRR